MLWTAFTLGLLGSTHCIGMCGPLSMALPLDRRARLEVGLVGLTYNFGRVITYFILGLLMGGIGSIVSISGWQQGISIGLGSLLLLIALFSIDLEYQFIKIKWLQRFYQFIQQKIKKLFSRRGMGSTLTIGMLNGLLPCGLVYIALAGAITTHSLFQGGLFMLLFGLGTLPLMVAMSFLGAFMPRKIKFYLRKATPIVMAGFACFLIWRGLAIELPANLEFLDALRNPVMCH